MAGDVLSFLKVQPVDYGAVIHVAFLYIGVSRGEMRRQEAKARIVVVQPDAYRAFVAGHSAQASL